MAEDTDLTHAPASVSSPWIQATRIAFIAFYACTLFAALRWLTSNVMEVGAGNRAVVLHMGAIVREQSSGLLWAWPKPIDQVVLVESAETLIERHVQTLMRSQAALNADAMAYDDDEGGPVPDALAGSGYLLTGDGAVVQLNVRVFYKVSDPRAYVLQYDHLLPALDRLVTRSALAVCAARDLDRILVARPELGASNQSDAEQREQLRKELVDQINLALGDLTQKGASLGINAIRVDVQSSLPQDTLNAFNSVLTASQLAEQALADARSDAARIIQLATQQADRSLQVASATASERVAKAQAETSAVNYLAVSIQNRTEPDLLMRVYRERMPLILKNAGSITMVEPNSDTRLILSGTEK
jgi:regulator of protease activity HflC (stomatin/prohibitin superfamily)